MKKLVALACLLILGLGIWWFVTNSTEREHRLNRILNSMTYIESEQSEGAVRLGMRWTTEAEKKKAYDTILGMMGNELKLNEELSVAKRNEMISNMYFWTFK